MQSLTTTALALLLTITGDPAAQHPPAGYPAPPAGFHWQRYPDGRWGLLQDGLSASAVCPDGRCRVVASSVGPPAALPSAVATTADPAAGSDALAEVNAKRASRGLRPFLPDPQLTAAARACATYRAERLIAGHTANDFAFVPAGGFARSAGCAAVAPSWGFLSCCLWENWTYAGAAKVRGRDGRDYCHVFVR